MACCLRELCKVHNLKPQISVFCSLPGCMKSNAEKHVVFLHSPCPCGSRSARATSPFAAWAVPNSGRDSTAVIVLVIRVSSVTDGVSSYFTNHVWERLDYLFHFHYVFIVHMRKVRALRDAETASPVRWVQFGAQGLCSGSFFTPLQEYWQDVYHVKT